jgi:putative phosphoesterase
LFRHALLRKTHSRKNVTKKPSQPAADRSDVSASPVRIGVISDTHGALDPTVLDVFAGVVQIIHAGDIVDPDILTMLESVAPVVAVAGNVEPPELAERLPREAAGVVGGVRYVVGHKKKRLFKRLAAGDLSGGAAGGHPDLVVFGHDHVPSVAWVDGTLYLNPGSASAPDEEDDGPTVAVVEAGPTGLTVRFVPLVRHDMRELNTRYLR